MENKFSKWNSALLLYSTKASPKSELPSHKIIHHYKNYQNQKLNTIKPFYRVPERKAEVWDLTLDTDDWNTLVG